MGSILSLPLSIKALGILRKLSLPSLICLLLCVALVGLIPFSLTLPRKLSCKKWLNSLQTALPGLLKGETPDNTSSAESDAQHIDLQEEILNLKSSIGRLTREIIGL